MPLHVFQLKRTDFAAYPTHLRRLSEHASQAPRWCRTYTDLNCLCYNSFTGQGQLLWVGVACRMGGRPLRLVSINLGIWFYEVETSDTGD
jgi:hypothetical protein